MQRTILPALAALLLGSLWLAPSAFASITPTLSLIPNGSGDQVEINVTGDPNASVILSYTELGGGPELAPLGSTNSSGNFSTSISSGQYGLTSGTLVTVITDGTNGPRSIATPWPTVTSASAFTLSQNAVVLDAGNMVAVTAENTGSASLYLSGNSNPQVANVSINGSTVTVSGVTSGSSTLTLCEVGESGACPTLFIMVEPAGQATLSFSQTNASIVSGQDLPITISGGSGTYSIVNNSYPSIIQASINGSVLTLSTGSGSGSSSIAVCSSDLSECGVVTASAGSANNSPVSFSNSSPSVSTNQTTTVNVYGPSGTVFYVSSNSNPSVVQANISGSTLSLAGITAGSSSITVCASTGTCASLTATVSQAVIGGSVVLSQNNLTLAPGQSVTVNVSGGTPPYFISGGTSSVAEVTVSSNALTILALGAGTSSLSVCSSAGGCTGLVVTVNGSALTTTTGTFSMSENSLTLAAGGSASVALYGNGVYYLSANTAPSVASVSISGTNALIAGLSPGTTSATICESGSSCGTLYITISAAGTITTPMITTPAAPAFVFTDYLVPGSQNSQVLQLQDLLQTEGYLTATPNGYFGNATEAAVLQFQAAHRIAQLGVVGPQTRAALNQVETSNASANTSTVSSTDISSMSLAQLESEAQSLESELTQVLARVSQLGG